MSNVFLLVKFSKMHQTFKRFILCTDGAQEQDLVNNLISAKISEPYNSREMIYWTFDYSNNEVFCLELLIAMTMP